MGIHAAENLGSPAYGFTDPDAFLSCDNPACLAPWLTRSGLVVWALHEDGPSSSRFSDRLIAACSPACLSSALHARGRGQRWSEPMPAGDWLDALRVSLDTVPLRTPIGELAGAA